MSLPWNRKLCYSNYVHSVHPEEEKLSINPKITPATFMEIQQIQIILNCPLTKLVSNVSLKPLFKPHFPTA